MQGVINLKKKKLVGRKEIIVIVLAVIITSVGIKASDGRVIVPPMEYDPDTAEELSEFVEVGQQGEIVSFAWVKEPREAHPMDKPFAWAMIKLDGADIPMIHCVAAAAEADVATGARVQVVWADETVGFITDIRCFELV